MGHIENIINDYINAKDTDYAIMIDGQWGSGKSYYWKHTLVPMISKVKTPINTKQCYKPIKVSLFGIQSVDDLLLARYFGKRIENNIP